MTTLPQLLRHHALCAARDEPIAPWEALDGDEQEVWLALARWVEADRERVREMAAGATLKWPGHDFIGLCPYGRDKPGDPTWSHTEKDVCPVCRANAEDSATVCTETVRGQIAAAIRALTLTLPEEAP